MNHADSSVFDLDDSIASLTKRSRIEDARGFAIGLHRFCGLLMSMSVDKYIQIILAGIIQCIIVSRLNSDAVSVSYSDREPVCIEFAKDIVCRAIAEIIAVSSHGTNRSVKIVKARKIGKSVSAENKAIGSAMHCGNLFNEMLASV